MITASVTRNKTGKTPKQNTVSGKVRGGQKGGSFRDCGAVVIKHRWVGCERAALGQEASGEGQEGSQSLGEDGVRSAAEGCSLQQAGTQWPHFHTAWQGLQWIKKKNNEGWQNLTTRP